MSKDKSVYSYSCYPCWHHWWEAINRINGENGAHFWIVSPQRHLWCCTCLSTQKVTEVAVERIKIDSFWENFKSCIHSLINTTDQMNWMLESEICRGIGSQTRCNHQTCTLRQTDGFSHRTWPKWLPFLCPVSGTLSPEVLQNNDNASCL